MAVQLIEPEGSESMRKNLRTKAIGKLRYTTGIEPRSDVWIVAAEPRYDHMASVARDARTLLGALTANIDWLRSGLAGQVPADGLVDSLADIETCCERLNNLLEDALLGTRQDGLTVRRQSISIGSVLNAALKQVRRVADGKQISIEVLTESDVAADLDRALITRAFAKLLEKVIAQVEVGAELAVRYRHEDEQVIVTFGRNDGTLHSIAPSRHSLRPGQPHSHRGEDPSDLDFCHTVAESHGGCLTVGTGITLYRMVLPWQGPPSSR